MYLLKPIVTQQISPSLYLHSTMYLLKLFPQRFEILGINVFTFHYVSIKTSYPYVMPCRYIYLHSTMYLLKRTLPIYNDRVLFNLHSTMYLLKPSAFSQQSFTLSRFTFHYVSIKTKLQSYLLSSELYLHSTMYLLKLCRL